MKNFFAKHSSWRTSSLAILCWLLMLWAGYQNIKRGATVLDYWIIPFLCFAVGMGLWHAADHKKSN